MEGVRKSLDNKNKPLKKSVFHGLSMDNSCARSAHELPMQFHGTRILLRFSFLAGFSHALHGYLHILVNTRSQHYFFDANVILSFARHNQPTSKVFNRLQYRKAGRTGVCEKTAVVKK